MPRPSPYRVLQKGPYRVHQRVAATYRVGRVEATVVERLLARARELGLLANRRYPPQDIERLHAISHPPRTTVVLTTHNQDIVNKLKRRVIVIQDGKIASDKANAEYTRREDT